MIRDWDKAKETDYVLKIWYEDDTTAIGTFHTLESAMRCIRRDPSPIKWAVIRKNTEEKVYEFKNKIINHASNN